jgi:methionyl-tRNA formyltransferase
VKRFIDASGHPYGCAKARYNNRVIKIYDCKIIKNKNFAEYHPGKIVSIDNNKPVVMCRDGLIQINISKYSDEKNVIYNSLRTRLV